MTEDRSGQVVTFYSYKGGTGRTMALANVAWILASAGKRVLVVDWDLESPGLHKFYGPFIPPKVLEGAAGVIDLIRDYEWATTEATERTDNWYESYADVQKHAFSLIWDFQGDGRLDFLSAGKQNSDYASTLAGLDWDDFYARLGGGRFFDALRTDMKRCYDYTLIDSRTGFSDVADICTIHMPDTLVDCYTPSAQGTEGAARVAEAVRGRYGHRNIRILPVAMRIDVAEKVKAEISRETARQLFGDLPTGMTDEQRREYWTSMFIPYQAFYAYEETLATFGDAPGDRTSLLSAYEALTSYISNGEVHRLAAMDEMQRHRIRAKFVRLPATASTDVVLRYAPDDQVWAEWIAHLLSAAGVHVHDGLDPDTPALAPGVRPMWIISMLPFVHDRAEGNPLAVYVANLQPSPQIPANQSAFISGLTAEQSAESLVRLVGRTLAEPRTVLIAGPRFPGTDPAVFRAPNRNARFTGRENDLRSLRELLRTGGKALLVPRSLPVALHGMGGIGKSQVAIEYAHRFRSAYDIVWWIDSDPTSGVDAQVAELGRRLDLPMQSTMPESVKAVRDALNRTDVSRRWLIVFDNAEDPATIGELLPRGANGHVLITSRDPRWGEQARTVQVDVFRREESIAHLRLRVPNVSAEDANRVAELLGDLPIAISAAGAWLADTQASVDDYLRQVEPGPDRGIADQGLDQAITATWDLSLRRLQERSPAALRLLQLCSVLAPEIAVDLVYSDEFASALAPYDHRVGDRIWRSSLVQQMNRLSLLRVDSKPAGPDAVHSGSERGSTGQIIIHRLLQYVVRSRTTTDELAEVREQAHVMLAGSRPAGEIEDLRTHARFDMIWPHLEPSGAAFSRHESVRQLLIDRVRYLYLIGDIDRGLSVARQVESSWQEMLESQSDPAASQALHQQLLQLRFNIANLIRDRGGFTESRRLDEVILREQRELLGAEHPHTLMTAGSLAADLRGLGLYAEALRMDETTHTAWVETFGEDNLRTLAALNNLAVSCRLTGQFSAARERDEAAYSRYRVISGDANPRTLGSATNLGRDLRELGDYDRSMELLRLVLETTNRTLGSESRSAMKARANLAVSLRIAGRVAEAGTYLEAAYEMFSQTTEATHPERLACQLSRAVNLLDLGNAEHALLEMKAVHRLYAAGLGDLHPHTLACLNNIAAALHALAQHTDGLKHAREAQNRFVERLGPTHPYAIVTQMNLAISLADTDDIQNAAVIVDDATTRMVRLLGPDHPQALRCQANREIIQQHLRPDMPSGLADIVARLAARLGQDHMIVAQFQRGNLVRRLIDPHPF